MQIHSRADFTTIRTEGAILPPDLLSRVREGDSDLEGLRPEDYHLDAGEKLNERVSRSWNQLVGIWASFQTQAEKVKEGDPGTTVTRERWLLPLLEELGYGRMQTSKAHELNGRSYPISHEWGCAPIHLVGLNVPLDRRTAGVAGAARTSPHSLVQEFLNRSDDHLWAFLSNGLQLRILRDNASLTRQAFVDFDLESMMEGEVYADFVLLWLLCHQSRVEGEKPEEFWLERWSQAAQEQGTRALDQLREGVEAAISILGAGYLAHPGNHVLKERLREGDLEPQEYYRQLLRMVYRLIFLFVAEDRDLLFDPDAESEARARYREHYSTARLRSLAERRRGTRHPDLYRGLYVVTEKLGTEEGCPALGLPGLGGFLWSREAISDLIECQLANHDLLEVVRSLAFTEEKRIRRAVDYKNLGPEELGSVYESLLELQPEMNVDAPTFELKVVGGSERKTTGSYYTPTSLIQCLLDSALDPVVEEAFKEDDPEQALLNLKICDPACGSGHFLVAAAHRVARQLASVRTGDEEPSPEAQRAALREVIGRCIYGADINLDAVELCKVNLWLEALEPGKPLTFLDDQILCGNSLLGTTPGLMEKGIPDKAFKPIEGDDRKFVSSLKKQNKQERSGQQSMFAEFEREDRVNYALLQREAIGIAETDDSSVKVVREKGEKYRAMLESDAYRHSKLLADAWCAAFVWHKTVEAPEPITEASFRKLVSKPSSISVATKKEIEHLSEQYQFFHWYLAFPGVFWLPEGEDEPENDQTDWSGGFDVVLGNPPWERVKLQEREYFSGIRPDISNARTASERRQLIASLKDEDPELYKQYKEAKRTSEAESHFVRHSGLNPFGASGDTNTYPLFVELSERVVNRSSKIGLIVKTGIISDYSMRAFFNHLAETRRIVSAYDFSNKDLIFPAVVPNERFTLLTLTGVNRPTSEFEISILNRSVTNPGIGNISWKLSPEDLSRINPNTKTCPLFRTPRDAEITRAIYSRLQVLIKKGPPFENPWGCLYFNMFHMTNDSGLFKHLEFINERAISPPSPVWGSGDEEYRALVEGKLFDQYKYRHGTFKGVPSNKRFGVKAEPNHPSLEQLNDSEYVTLPRYWVPENETRKRYQEKLGYVPGAVLSFRDVCRTHTDLRTVRACIYPSRGFGNSAPLLLFPGSIQEEHAEKSLLLCSNMLAFVFDYVARQKFSGGHLNKYILDQLPFIDPKNKLLPWKDSRDLHDWISDRAIELTYVSYELRDFAMDCGYEIPPFCWNEDRRFILRCELDASYFHLYGIERYDVDYIMDTFPIFKQREEEEYGEYRTKRVILEIYDEMQRAIATGVPYHTRLDPPPADPRVAHAPRES